MLGRTLYPWQRYVADVGLEVDPVTGQLAYDEVIVLVQRRAGKTVLIEPITLHRCGRPGEARQAWLTAQKRDNAVKRWRDATDMIMRADPSVRRKIGQAQEIARWPSGSKFLPFAPDEDTMHGEDPDLVWVDELWSFTLDQQRKIQQGYRPAWSVKAGQEWKLSAAGTARSAWLKSDRQRGRAAVESGGRSRIAFFEWCVPELVGGVPVAELDDDRLIAVTLANHPRRDHGLRPGFLAGELADLGRPGFLRAYGGLDEDESDRDDLVPAEQLAAAFTPDRIPERVRVAFGVEVDPDRREASISVAWRDGDGRALTQVIDHRPGSSWTAARVRELVAANQGGNAVGVVAIANAGPARNVADELDRAGVPLLRVSQVDVAAGCSSLYDQLTAAEPTVTHDNDGRLLDALRAAGWRRLGGGGRAWASNTGQPITALGSHTLAAWGFDHMPEEAPAPAPFRIY